MGWFLVERDADIFGHKFIAAVARWLGGVPASHLRAEWDGRLYSVWVWQGEGPVEPFPGDESVKDADADDLIDWPG